MIHPTAIIHPGAELGAGVSVGPYCLIGEGVHLGGECVLHNNVTLTGPSVIGARNTFFPGACIGGVTQDLKYTGEPTYLDLTARHQSELRRAQPRGHHRTPGPRRA